MPYDQNGNWVPEQDPVEGIYGHYGAAGPHGTNSITGQHRESIARYAEKREQARREGSREETYGNWGAEQEFAQKVLEDARTGETSVAQQQLRQGMADAARTGAGLAVSRGSNPMASRAAVYGAGQMGADASRTSAALRAQEMQAAQAAMLGTYGRRTDAGLQMQQTDAAQEQALQQTALGEQGLNIEEKKRQDENKWKTVSAAAGGAGAILGAMSDPRYKVIHSGMGPSRHEGATRQQRAAETYQPQFDRRAAEVYEPYGGQKTEEHGRKERERKEKEDEERRKRVAKFGQSIQDWSKTLSDPRMKDAVKPIERSEPTTPSNYGSDYKPNIQPEEDGGILSGLSDPRLKKKVEELTHERDMYFDIAKAQRKAASKPVVRGETQTGKVQDIYADLEARLDQEEAEENIYKTMASIQGMKEIPYVRPRAGGAENELYIPSHVPDYNRIMAEEALRRRVRNRTHEDYISEPSPTYHDTAVSSLSDPRLKEIVSGLQRENTMLTRQLQQNRPSYPNAQGVPQMQGDMNLQYQPMNTPGGQGIPEWGKPVKTGDPTLDAINEALAAENAYVEQQLSANLPQPAERMQLAQGASPIEYEYNKQAQQEYGMPPGRRVGVDAMRTREEGGPLGKAITDRGPRGEYLINPAGTESVNLAVNSAQDQELESIKRKLAEIQMQIPGGGVNTPGGQGIPNF